MRENKSYANNYLIGIDVGTSTTKISIIDIKGNLKYSNAREYKINYIPNGLVQQNPDDWYESLIYLLRDSLSQLDLEKNKVMAIGISSQSNTLVSVNKNGDVLYPAILYLDKRAIDICNSFKDAEEGKRIYELGGTTLKPSYTALQILWVKENKPDIYNKTYKFLTANGYIIQKLTGVFSQDITQTGMTGIFDREKNDWSDELIDVFAIDKNKLPKIYNSSDIIGRTNKEFSKSTKLFDGIPVIAGSLDVASSMLGAGCIDKGSSFIEMGSVINLAVLTGKQISDKNFQTYPSAIPGLYIIAGSVDGAGNSIKWFLDNIFRGYKENEELYSNESAFNMLNKELESTGVGADNLLFLPYMAGMRTPISNLMSKGAFLGLKLSTRKIDIYRSIMEGCSYGLKYNLDIMLDRGINVRNNSIISGGGSRNKFWVDIMSNILNIKIKHSLYNNGASIGSAILSGIGCGVFESFKEAKEKVCKYDYIFSPVKNLTKRYEKFYYSFRDFIKKILKDLDHLENID